VVVRELDLELRLVTGRLARQARVELGHQALGAKLDREVLPGRTLERLSVDRPLEVDHDDIALRGRALHRVQAAEPLTQALELGVDGIGGHLDLLLADLEAAVLPQLGRRAHPDLNGEHQLLALAG
jgi:hypothetical protein